MPTALALDDVKGFQDDEGYKRMLEDPTIPSSDALGDWLYRQCQITHTNKNAKKKKMKSVPSSGFDERKQHSASEVGSFFAAVFTASSGLCGLACASNGDQNCRDDGVRGSVPESV